MFIVSTPSHYTVFEDFDEASKKYVDELNAGWPIRKISLLTFYNDEWESSWYEIRFFHPESQIRERYAEV